VVGQVENIKARSAKYFAHEKTPCDFVGEKSPAAGKRKTRRRATVVD
jgi:hypothetical protein